MIKDFEKAILLSVTGSKDSDWRDKLAELDSLGIREAALFLSQFNQGQRKRIYRALLDTKLKNIPLCHVRNDMEVEELVFLETKFKVKYFTVHENSFSFMDKWPGFAEKIYLEMNYDDAVSQRVMVEKIGGFCVDFSHFKAAQEKWTDDFEYIYYRKGKASFSCNHLNGYDSKKNPDIHIIKNLKQFDYLKTLPKFLFGDVIALEVENGIKEQISFKKYLVGYLNKFFSK